MSKSKQQILIENLHSQYTNLIIQEQYNGYIINIENDTVYCRLFTQQDEEYDCELDKKLFPLEYLEDNVHFFLLIGEINGQPFTHINYFLLTQEEIDEAQERAIQLAKSLDGIDFTARLAQ